MHKTLPRGWLVAVALLAGSLGADAAEDPKRPKDAAEAVQEGNVQNWIEYYQRTRPPPADRAKEPVATPAETKPGESTEPVKR